MLFVVPAFMHYFDNPKGSIPTWLINWAAQVRVEGSSGESWSKLRWELKAAQVRVEGSSGESWRQLRWELKAAQVRVEGSSGKSWRQLRWELKAAQVRVEGSSGKSWRQLRWELKAALLRVEAAVPLAQISSVKLACKVCGCILFIVFVSFLFLFFFCLLVFWWVFFLQPGLMSVHNFKD